MHQIKKIEKSDFKNINIRIGLSFFTIFALLIALIIFLTSLKFQNIIEASENRLSENITNVLSISISRISFSGKYQAQVFSDQLLEKEDSIKYIVILASNGDIISKSYNEQYKDFIENVHMSYMKIYATEIEQLNKKGKEINYVHCCGNQDIKEIAMPYFGSFDQGQIGVIVAGISSFKTAKAIKASRLILLLIGLVVTLLGVVLIYVVTNRISYPIQRLARMFQSVLKYAPMSLMIKDRNENIIAVSDEYKKRFLNDQSARLNAEDFDRLFEKGTDTTEKLNDVKSLNNETLSLLTFKFPLLAPDGSTEGVCGIATDVTEREKIQKALAKSEEEFRSIYETSSVGIINIGPDFKIIRANRSFQEILGYTESELRLIDLSEITYPDDKSIGCNELKSIIDGTNERVEFEKRYIRKDGKVVWVHLSVSGLRNEKDEFLQTVTIVENITKRKLAEESRDRLLEKEQAARLEAQQAVQVRDDFLSIASHELKTPLTTLILQTHLLNKLLEQDKLSSLSRERQQDLLRISNQSLDRFQKLINNLLDVSRLERQQLVLTKEEVDLHALVSDIIQSFQMEFEENKCPVKFIGDDRPVGYWERIRVEQVVINLLSNAIKFGAGKEITITITKDGDSAKLSVKDLGIGISPKDQERIFERFERAVSLNSFGGLGLGLYISRQIVEAHGGSISVSSEVGQGSTFTVQLPLRRDV